MVHNTVNVTSTRLPMRESFVFIISKAGTDTVLCSLSDMGERNHGSLTKPDVMTDLFNQEVIWIDFDY